MESLDHPRCPALAEKEDFRLESLQELEEMETRIRELWAAACAAGREHNVLVRSAIAQLKEKALDVRKAMLRIPEATEVTWRVLRNGVQRSIQDLQKTYRDASRAMDAMFREPSARL